MNKIGLFPLGIVLFPESALPLHIFEERYKLLINHCLTSGNVFGINLISSQKMYEIGCTAKIADVMKIYDDKKMDILISGHRRYKLNNFTDGEQPYFIGDIDYFEDIAETPDLELIEDCVDLYNLIVENIKSVKIEPIVANHLTTNKPSFLIAQKAGLTAIQKQELLEMDSENRRLNSLRDHLRKLLPMIKEAETISKIIKNDGYYQQINPGLKF